MTEPIATATASITATSITGATTWTTFTTAILWVLSLFTGIDMATVMGAFAGSGIFVMSSKDLTSIKKITHFMISFLAGNVAASFTAEAAALLLLQRIHVPLGVGALIAASISVTILLWLIDKARDVNSILHFIKEKK